VPALQDEVDVYGSYAVVDDTTFVRPGRPRDGEARLLDAAELLLGAADTRGRAQPLLSLGEQQLTELEESEGCWPRQSPLKLSRATPSNARLN
jgi:hypothetical protein